MKKQKIKYHTIILERTDEKPLVFKGAMLATASGSPLEDDEHIYSGCKDQWDVFRVYQTPRKKFVCQIVTCDYRGESWCKRSVKKCAGVQDIIDFFGEEELAQQLYERLGFDNLVAHPTRFDY